MYGSPILSILQSLSEKEMRLCTDFVQSPIYNKHEKVTELFLLLKKMHPNFEESKVHKEIIFKKLYVKQPYNDQQMRNLMSQLLGVLRRFLAFVNLQNTRHWEQLLWTEEMVNRQLREVAQTALTKLEADIEQSQQANEHYLFCKRWLDVTKMGLMNASMRNTFNPDVILAPLHSYSAEFMLNITGFYSFYSVVQKAHPLPTNNSLIEQLYRLLKPYCTKYPLVDIIYQTYQMQNTGEMQYYEGLKQYLTPEQLNQIPDEYQKMLLISLINFQMGQQMVQISPQEHIDIKNLYLTRFVAGNDPLPHLSITFFENMVINLLKMRNYIHALGFMEKYQNCLPPDVRESTISFCKARYFFELKDYPQTLHYLQITNFDLISRKIHHKCLLIQVFYELNDETAFTAQIDTFRHFLLNNQSLTDDFKERYRNFIRLVVKLFRIKNRTGQDKLAAIQTQLSQQPFAYNQLWLAEKANELS